MMSLVIMIAGVSNGLAEDPRAITSIHGYSLKNKPGPKGDFNIWVITHENAFNEEFVAGEDAAVRPDFEKQLVVAMSVQTFNYVYRVSFERSVVDKGELHIYFRVKKESVDAEPGLVTVAAIEKTPGLKKVHFYHDNIRVRTIPIVAVY